MLSKVNFNNSKEMCDLIDEVCENFHKTTYNLPSIKDNVVLKHKSWLKDQHSSINPTSNLTDVNEVKFFVKSLKNNKAPGLDAISPIILKNMTNTFFVVITRIFNWCIVHGYFPKLFKVAKVVPILKPGKDAKSPNLAQ